MVSEFTEYMRKTLRKKGMSQQQVFRSADISDKYGYKLISGEKHTRQRDILIKLGIVARFTEAEISGILASSHEGKRFAHGNQTGCCG